MSKVSQSYKDFLYDELCFTLRLYPRWKWNSDLLEVAAIFFPIVIVEADTSD